jgi:hypothetical protein
MLSCSPQTCFEETNAFVKAYFYLESTGAAASPDTLTLYGLNMESNMIYNKSPKLKSILIPLDNSADKSTFIIRINGISDTLELHYSSYPHLISSECGYTFYHELDTDRIHTRNVIKNISIEKSKITIINEENIRIYY